MTEPTTTEAFSLRRRVEERPTDGVDPRSRYVDHFWIPTLGPTAVCLARTMMRMIAREGRAVVVQAEDLRAILGLHDDDAPAVLDRAVDRLADHGIVTRREGEGGGAPPGAGPVPLPR